MRRFKSKMAICLMLVVAMVFSPISWVGGEVKAANPLVDTKAATLNNPVTKSPNVPQGRDHCGLRTTVFK